MTDDEAAERLQEISQNHDTEGGHVYADELLCEVLKSLGYTKTVEAFENMEKWYA